MRLRFQNLPLIEVVIRLAPSTLLPVDLDRLCRLADRLRRRLPVVQDLDAPLAGIGPFQIEVGFGQSLGARYSDSERGLSILVQPNLIQAVWQNTALTPAIAYPHFEEMLKLLKWAITGLSATGLGSAPPTFAAANMSYTNFVATDNPPGYTDLARYLVPRAQCGLLSGSGRIHEHNVSWRDPSGADVRLHVRGVGQSGTAPLPNGMVVTTVAGQNFTPEAWPGTQIRANHQLLQKLFYDIITREAKQEWGLVDGSQV